MRRTTGLCICIFLCLIARSLQAQTAQFLWEDSTTQGAWESVYGSDGYNVISSTTQYQNYPSYATVTPTGQTEYTWGTGLSVPNALEEPGVSPPNNRIAAQWYNNASLTIDLNLTDGQVHQVALYCLDYGDTNGRAQTVTIVNPANGNVLDSRSETSFTTGQYLVWNLSGHVQIQVIRLAQYNATVSGLFFDPPGRPTIIGLSQQAGQVGAPVTLFGYNFGTTTGTLTFNGTAATATQWSNNSITTTVPTGASSGPVVVTASSKHSNNTNTFAVLSGQTLQFLGENTYTEGTWQGVYGADGYNVISSTTQYQDYPSYATVTPTGQTEYTWGTNLSDPRGLQEPSVQPPNNRIAATWYSSTSFTIDINLTDGLTHEIAVYCLDWDNQGRIETVNILNPQNGSVLDSHTISSFTNGEYLVWNLSGHIQIQFVEVAGPNVGLSGLFFSPSGQSIATIWGLSQSVGQVGTSVTVVGTNFGTSGALTFNGTAATPTQWTSNSITAPVPTGATTGNIVVTASGVASNAAVFTVTPSITSISPPSGPLATVVQINGTGFGSSQGNTAYVFNGISQTPGLWSSTQVTSELPSALTSGPVYVIIGGSNPATFTLVGNGGISGTVTNLANGNAISGATVGLYLNNVLQTSTTTSSTGIYSFSNIAAGTYSLTFSSTNFSTASIATVPVDAGGNTTENIALSTPQITTLSPSSGPVNTVVTINGSGFGALQGASTVAFGTIGAAATQWSNTAIVVSVPSGATTGSVTVSVAGAGSNTVTFTVGSATISGTVMSGGTGVTGATINALQSGVIRNSSTSGSGGSYSIGNLPPGKYDMDVIASGYGTQAVSGISVTVNNTTTENFTLSTAGTISGTITQSNGTTAISGAAVSVNQGYTVVGTATTNGSGSYSVATLGPATYSVTASSPGFDTTTKSGQVVTSGNTTTTNISLGSQATVSYAYDQAGRLAGVVDSLNNSAVYSYDAAGNIQSITRKAATAVTITDFVPNSGIVGTPVTVNGSGFSSTASQNTVTFNGTAATVSSSSPTQILTSVPTGATSGKIKVTAPAGSATSTASFTVTTSNGLPTITNFSPSMAVPGTTTVTINGTNFDSTASHDGLTVNVNKTYASAATSTSLTTTVPGLVTSGHITVTTTVGSYTTQGYLFIPPTGYLTSQVGFTGEAALGGQVVVSLSTANEIALAVVDMTAGQWLSVGTVSTFTSNVPYTVYDPYGNVLGSGSIGNGTSYFDTNRAVGVTGTCTIMLAPGNVTGSVTLSPVADIVEPITVGGAPLVVPPTSPGQSAHLSFFANAGTRIYLYAYNPTGTKDQNGNQGSSIKMLDPSGNELLGCCGWGGGAPGSTWYGYTGLLTLQTTGTYTIDYTASGFSTWGATFQVGSVPADVTMPITVSPAGGPPAPVTIATQSVGQSAHLTFTGTANERLYLYAYNPTGTKDQYGNQGSSITMLDPSGNELLGCCGWGGGAPGSTWNGYSGLITLQSNGSYTINFTPSGLSTWGATFSLVTIPADVTNTITVSPAGGPPAPVTIATQYPGQSAHLTFTGSTNQRLYLLAYNPTGTKDSNGNQGSSITMLNSTTGQELLGCCGWGGGAPGSTWYGYSGLITLQSTGSYTINFTPSGLSTWGATFSLVTIPADVTNTITVSPAGGPPAPVTIATQYAGQSAHLTFTGSANQRLYLYAYTPTGAADQYGNSGSSISMLNSTTGQELLGCCGWGGGAPGSTWYGYSGLITLQSTGSYTINFTPSGLSTWGATFSLVTIPTDVTNTITVAAAGTTAPVTIATQYAGQSAHLTFTGAANQTLFLYAYNPTGAADKYGNSGSSISMLNSTTGQELLGCCGWGGGAPGGTWYGYSGLITLQSTGSYTINFTPSGLSTWGATFSLVTIPAVASASIGLNSPVALATSYIGQSGQLTFDNTTVNQQVYLYIYTPTGTKDQYGNQGSSINMLGPTGNTVIGNFGGGNPGSTWTYCSSEVTLPSTGNYTINFAPNGMSLWGATFELMTTPCP